MVVSDLTEVDLGARHVNGAMELVAEAGWNQTADDWRMMISAGRAFGVEDSTRRLVASAVALPFGAEFGWVSMVLVAGDWRRRGLATRLLDRAIDWQTSAGRIPMLDATPAGETVYGSRGFVGTFALQRWQAHSPQAGAGTGRAVREVGGGDLGAILGLDAEIFGGDREAIIRDIAMRPGARGWVLGDGDGFLLSRAGSRARQLGPLAAGDEASAIALLRVAFRELDGPVFLDVPDQHAHLIHALKGAGFTSQRPFLRMQKGPRALFGDVSRTFVIAGPELG